MKNNIKNSKLKELEKNSKKDLSKFVKDVQKGTYTNEKVDSNMRVSAYATTSSNMQTYTFGVR